jgi:membrane associated rhomboid family serine protease
VFPLRDNIPLSRLPVVTIAIVLVNVIAYVLEIRHGGSFFGGPTEQTAVRWGAIPYELTHPGDHCEVIVHTLRSGTASTVHCQGRPGVSGTVSGQPATAVTVLTSMFLHGGFLPIAANMLFLAVFGPTVEDAMGRLRFAVFYLLGGIVALAALLAAGPDSTDPALGASGAIAAVLGGYVLLHPRARVITLIFIIFFVTIVEIPAPALIAVWFVLDGIAAAINSTGTEGLAYLAQVGGGFLFGLAAIRAFAKRVPPRGGRTAVGLA